MSIHYGKISEWPTESINTVKRSLGMMPFDVYIGQSDSCCIQHKRTNDFCKTHICIAYNSIYKLFVAWNAGVKIKLSKGKVITLDVHRLYAYEFHQRKNDKLIVNKYVSRSGNSQYPNCIEKVALIGSQALYEFCQSYPLFLYPDENDPKNTAFVAPDAVDLLLGAGDDAIQREVIKVNQKKRSQRFRSMIISDNSKCIICGSEEFKILEAAHIIPVADGGTDTADNGICLCANHHKMYDAGILEIDFENQIFECKNTSEKNMLWYKEAQKRGMKLLL